MTATVLTFRTKAQKITTQAPERRPGEWTREDRQTLLAASYALPIGHSVEFCQDDEGADFAMVTPDFPMDAEGRFVVGWTHEGQLAITDTTTGFTQTAHTVAEVADRMKAMAS